MWRLRRRVASRLVHDARRLGGSFGLRPDCPLQGGGRGGGRTAFPPRRSCDPSVVFGQEDSSSTASPIWRATRSSAAGGGGRAKFQPVFVGDVAQAVAAALEPPRAPAKPTSWAGRSAELPRGAGADRPHHRPPPPLRGLPLRSPSSAPTLAALLPNPPLTPDQVDLLKGDNVVAPARKASPISASPPGGFENDPADLSLALPQDRPVQATAN